MEGLNDIWQQGPAADLFADQYPTLYDLLFMSSSSPRGLWALVTTHSTSNSATAPIGGAIQIEMRWR